VTSQPYFFFVFADTGKSLLLIIPFIVLPVEAVEVEKCYFFASSCYCSKNNSYFCNLQKQNEAIIL